MTEYSESSGSDDSSFYKNIDQFMNTNDQDKADKNEHTLYSQLKSMVDDKNNEYKNDEMKLYNLTTDNYKLKVSLY